MLLLLLIEMCCRGLSGFVYSAVEKQPPPALELRPEQHNERQPPNSFASGRHLAAR
jgi:hypothetical protein